MKIRENQNWTTPFAVAAIGFSLVIQVVVSYASAAQSSAPPKPLEVLRINAPQPPVKDESNPQPPKAARISPSDNRLKLLKEGFEAAAKGDGAKIDQLQKAIGDDAARALLEWSYLRAAPSEPSFVRLKTFLKSHDWPGESPIRFKTEQILLAANFPPETVIEYFGDKKPEWPQGRIALAEALRKSGNKDQAKILMRDTWRTMELSTANEQEIQKRFPGAISHPDLKYRMDLYLYQENAKAAQRIAAQLGGSDLQLANARIAVIKKAANAKQLLEAVSAAGQQDPGYIFSKIQLLRRQDKDREAVDLMLKAPINVNVLVDSDQWWTERRLQARAALDLGDYQAAYKIAANHSALNDVDRMEAEFHAGWIALRFLKDPRIAEKHFINLMSDAEKPISVSRGAYWRGRTLDSLGKNLEAQKFYKIAAAYTTTYYGLLANAKLGNDSFFLRSPPKADASAQKKFENLETVRALRWLEAAGDTTRANMFVTDMSKNLKDPGDLALLAQITQDMNDIPAGVRLAKQALYRNLPLDTYAFPLGGVPNVFRDGDVERSLALAIARQESVFDPKVKSAVGATGLFQLMPATAAAMAKRSNVAWQPKRITDPVYNTQLGIAYLNKLVSDLGGSYVLTFAAYNAGPGNVRKWIERFGDPRNPNVDPIDWVERIPFTETRNYVMRVMENLQVYRARIKTNMTSGILIEADLHRGQLR